MAYSISVAVGDKLTMRTLTSGIVVSGVEMPLPQAARTNVAATAAARTRIRDILIIDIVLPPGIWRKKSGSH
jgi:glutamyl-tRNA reductase